MRCAGSLSGRLLSPSFGQSAVLHMGRRSEREHAKGRFISSADAWVAATALVLAAPLVTNNLKDYRHLDKLQIISAAAE
jgi:predicted nucleic acid-binding protein